MIHNDSPRARGRKKRKKKKKKKKEKKRNGRVMGFFSAGAGPVPNMADLSKDDSKAKYVMTLLRFFFFLFLEKKGEIPRF